ncbi:MAG: hypothetical protein AABZ39_02650 [Spirochaetota bacterium]
MNILLAILILAILQWLNHRSLYRAEVDIPMKRKHVLFALQAAVIVLLVQPLADINFAMSCTCARPSTTAVVLDDSFSMRRNYDVLMLTNEFRRFCEAKDRAIERYSADGFVRPYREPLFLRASDHHSLFAFLADARPSSVVMISDGESMTLMPGLTNMMMVRPEGRPFIAISGIMPRTMREGIETELIYTVAYRGAAAAAVVTLSENRRTYATIPIRLASATNVRLRIPYRPRAASEVLLTAAVSGVTNDTAADDNVRNDIVAIERESTSVMLIGGAPSKEYGMLKTFLAGDSSIRLSAFAASESVPAMSADLVIIVNPTREAVSHASVPIERALLRGTPFIIFYSSIAEDVSGFSGLFPAVTRRNGKIALSVTDNASILTRIGTTDAENDARWRSMTMFDVLFVPDRELTVLIKGNDAPAISSAIAGRSRVVYVGCAPLWRLRLFGTAVGLSGLYDAVVSTLVHESTRPSFGSIAASERTCDIGGTIQVRVRSGRTGTLSAFYSAASHTNISSSAAVEVDARAVSRVPIGASPVAVTCMSPGLCTLRFESGDRREDMLIAVNPAYGEIVATGTDAMRAIASNTGGAYFTALDTAHAASIWRAIPPMKIREMRTVAVNVWRNWPFLIITVLLCLLLWYLKRSFGLH